MPNTFDVERLEKRIPMTVAVHISGHERAPGVETTFTENVSSRGARVSSIRRWRPNENVEIRIVARRFPRPGARGVLPARKAKALSSDLSS